MIPEPVGEEYYTKIIPLPYIICTDHIAHFLINQNKKISTT